VLKVPLNPNSIYQSRPLYDDHDNHSTAERAFAYNYGCVGTRNSCNQFVGPTNVVPSNSTLL